MTHEEHWDSETNGYELSMVRQLPPPQVFPYERFASGNSRRELGIGEYKI